MGTSSSTRLRAYVTADVVASTHFLATYGVEATVTANDTVRSVIEQAAQGGTIVDHSGDGWLLAFTSARQAHAAAASIQGRMLDETAHSSGLTLRVGVACVEADDVSSVSRIIDRRLGEALSRAEPGSVVIDPIVGRLLDGEATASGQAAGSVDHGAPAATLHVVMFTDVIGAEATSSSGPPFARKIGERCIPEHGGTIVDTNGAGHVALFDSIAAAKQAADAHHELAALSRVSVHEPHELAFGVALALGDVVRSDGLPFGLAVVESARLLAHASPDTTVVSDDVDSLDSSRPSDADLSESLGPLLLKGLSAPVPATRTRRTSWLSVAAPLPASLDRARQFPLIGRDAALGILDEAWAHTRDGAGSVMMISGEEGIGKTRLVSELARRLHGEGALVLYGAGLDGPSAPYASLAGALRAATGFDDDLAAAVSNRIGPLAALFGSPALADSVDTIATQGGLFDAIAETLGRIADQRPTLLVLDDLQWADPDTIRLLEELAADAGLGRLLVVGTTRAEHLDDRERSTRLASLIERRNVAHYRLQRLQTHDVIELMETQRPVRLDAAERAFAQRFTTVTGGSPLHVEELLRHLATDGALVDADGGWHLSGSADDIELPDSVIDLMSTRARRLDPDVRRVLTTAAVIGQSFEVDVLADVSERSIDEVLDALEIAEVHRLVLADEGGRISFVDEIARAALARELKAARRSSLHRRIAEVITDRYPHEIDRLADHWANALGSDAAVKALEYDLKAGARDMASVAWEASVDRHRRILGTLGRDPHTDPALVASTHFALGVSLRSLGLEEFRPELLTAATLARSIGDSELLARCAIAMMRPGAWYPEAAVVDHEIVDMCEDALMLLSPDAPLRSRVLAALAVNLTFADVPDRQQALIDEAYVIADRLADPLLRGRVIAAELISFHDPDRFDRRLQLAEELRRIGRATGESELLFVGCLFDGYESLCAGDFDRAAQRVAEMRPIGLATRQYWPDYLSDQFPVALALARHDPATPLMIEERRQRFEHQPVDSNGAAVIQHATWAMATGTLSEMLLALAGAADEHAQDDWSQKWNYAIAKAYLDAGDVQRAIELYESTDEPEFDFYWLSSSYHLGALGLEAGREDLCHRALQVLMPYRGRFTPIGLGVCVTAQVSVALGQASLGLGRFDDAEEFFTEAIEQAEALGFPYFATNARRYLARTLLQIPSRHDEATALLDAVVEAAEHHGFAAELAEAEVLLGQLNAA